MPNNMTFEIPMTLQVQQESLHFNGSASILSPVTVPVSMNVEQAPRVIFGGFEVITIDGKNYLKVTTNS